MSQTVDDVVAVPIMEPTNRIATPVSTREPLKVSVYERMSKAAAQLMPIFPYGDAGSIVPCGGVLFGNPGKEHGHFFHANSVSEVVVTFGSHEAMLQTGSIMATQKFHGVNSFLRDQNNPAAFAVVTVTQHQSEEAGQREALVAKCRECTHELVRHEYEAGPEGAPDFDPLRFGQVDDKYRQFSTMVGSAEFADIRNTYEKRTCSNCGHVNDPFPAQPWGWRRLVDQTRVVNAAARALSDAAKGMK